MAEQSHIDRSLKTVACFVITVSDTRDASTDRSGATIKGMLEEGGHALAGYEIVKDEPEDIRALLGTALAADGVDVVLLNGGTGIAPRDGTYEVVSGVIEKRIDGFGELFRYLSYQEIGAAAMLSRAVAGAVGSRIVVSMPGSRGAVETAMKDLLLPQLGHMVAQARGI
ncbi:MAG: MogA/MoaB family molybdenum cofactor biosynthesis protein [Deltaproteobacteria bacterium]|nr:MogA/MoaB family molybdenum cofactor biosynthesis protein [Deltaproteobacteria bacterium]